MRENPGPDQVLERQRSRAFTRVVLGGPWARCLLLCPQILTATQRQIPVLSLWVRTPRFRTMHEPHQGAVPRFPTRASSGALVNTRLGHLPFLHTAQRVHTDVCVRSQRCRLGQAGPASVSFLLGCLPPAVDNVPGAGFCQAGTACCLALHLFYDFCL